MRGWGGRERTERERIGQSPGACLHNEEMNECLGGEGQVAVSVAGWKSRGVGVWQRKINTTCKKGIRDTERGGFSWDVMRIKRLE